MKPKTLSLIAGVVFTLSFFLPAYVDSTGFECFNFCLKLIPRFPTESLPKWMYYSAFVLTNLTFVAVVALDFSRTGLKKARLIISAVAFFHVLSWLLTNIFRNEISMLKSGYFLWLLAYALLLAAQIRRTSSKPAPASGGD